jgi:hypothetical protein
MTTPESPNLVRLAALACEEAEALVALLPLLIEVQYDRSLAGMGAREAGTRRPVGGHSDPTADVAVDPARLYVRKVLGRSTPHLEEAVKNLRGVRIAAERALNTWEGDRD